MTLLIGLAGLSVGGVARAAGPALTDEALKRLQISGEQQRGLLRGEVISYPVGEYSERELAVGLAMFVMAPLGQVAEYLASGELLARDATISAHGLVPDPAQPAGLPAGRFSGSERDEAESLLEAGPGTRFNLSSAEIEALRALRASVGSGSVTAEQVSDEYRKLLRDRCGGRSSTRTSSLATARSCAARWRAIRPLSPRRRSTAATGSSAACSDDRT